MQIKTDVHRLECRPFVAVVEAIPSRDGKRVRGGEIKHVGDKAVGQPVADTGKRPVERFIARLTLQLSGVQDGIVNCLDQVRCEQPEGHLSFK